MLAGRKGGRSAEQSLGNSLMPLPMATAMAMAMAEMKLHSAWQVHVL